MRIVGLCLLFVLSYVIAVVVLFPAAPVVDHFRSRLGPVALEGVNGKLYKGVIDRVRSTDDLLPLEFENVGWALAPSTLLEGGTGSSFSFDGYGGDGEGLLTRKWNGDIVLTDFRINALAKTLEPLLPVPVASFSGKLDGEFSEVVLINNLLSRMNGKLSWQEAVLETPIAANFGTVDVTVKPDGEKTHLITLSANGGDVTMDGTVTMALNGDFAADVLFTPSTNAPAAVLNGLQSLGRADAQGRVRLKQQGNINRLM